MYCRNCGTLNETDAMFCSECGNKLEAAVPAVSPGQTISPTIVQKSPKKKIVLTLLSLLIIIGAVASVFFMKGSSASDLEQYENQISLGKKYMEEQDYEAALLAFDKAIDILPDEDEAYLEKSSVYTQMDDHDAAVAVLEQGYNKNQSTSLQKAIEKLSDDTDTNNSDNASDDTKKPDPAEPENSLSHSQTVSNVNYNGYAAADDAYIYYRGNEREEHTVQYDGFSTSYSVYSLYKEPLAGGEPVLLASDVYEQPCLYMSDDFLYYLTYGYTATDNSPVSIIKYDLQNDSSEALDIDYTDRFVIKDDILYYSDYEQLYAYDLIHNTSEWMFTSCDALECLVLTDTGLYVSTFMYQGDYIPGEETLSRDEEGIFYISFDGSEISQLYTGYCTNLQFYDNSLYFTIYGEDSAFCRLDIDTGKVSTLDTDTSYITHIYDGYMYGLDHEHNNIVKLDMDGNIIETMVTDSYTLNILETGHLCYVQDGRVHILPPS